MDKPVRLCSRSEPLHASIWPTAFKLGLQFKEELFVSNLKKQKKQQTKKSNVPKLWSPWHRSQERGVPLCVFEIIHLHYAGLCAVWCRRDVLCSAKPRACLWHCINNSHTAIISVIPSRSHTPRITRIILIFKTVTLKRRGGKGGNKKPDPVFVADSAVEGERGFAEHQNFCRLPKEPPDGAYYFSCTCFYHKTTEKEEWQGGEREIKAMREIKAKDKKGIESFCYCKKTRDVFVFSVP